MSMLTSLVLISSVAVSGLLAAQVRSYRRRERERRHAHWVARNDAIQRGHRRPA